MYKCVSDAIDFIKTRASKAASVDLNDKLDEIKDILAEKNIIPTREVQVSKKTNPVVIILAVIGAISIVAAIAYAVFSFFFAPEDSEDFEDFDDDDFDDDLDGDD